MTEFAATFNTWVEDQLFLTIPSEVAAFSFNLYEHYQGCFGVELIGAKRFDPVDEDWACEEIWEPMFRGIDIPQDFSGPDWETCLNRVRPLVRAFVASEQPGAVILKNSQGVGLGFVDGNLEIVWQSENSH